MQRGLVVVGLLVGLAGGATAQTPRTIDPGMTQAQVIERLGQPAAIRTTGGSTYLFYKNGCVKACGMDDVVILDGDGVVDAIFRSSGRQYTGRSSSPRAVSAAEAAHAHRVIQAGSPMSPAPDTDRTAAPPAPANQAGVAPAPAAAAAPLPAPVPVARPNLAPTRSADTVTGSLRIEVRSGRAIRGTKQQKDGASTGSTGTATPPPVQDTTHHGGGQKPEG